jgi:hypothetical protein
MAKREEIGAKRQREKLPEKLKKLKEEDEKNKNAYTVKHWARQNTAKECVDVSPFRTAQQKTTALIKLVDHLVCLVNLVQQILKVSQRLVNTNEDWAYGWGSP